MLKSAKVGLAADVGFFAYSALLDDQTGRVRQVVEMCPALLSLAAVLTPQCEEARELVEGIKRGQKLNELIARMLQCVAPPAKDGTLNRAAIALVRNAPSLPFKKLMAVLCAPGVDINDLQSCRDRDAWFRVVAAWGDAASRVSDMRVRDRIGSFISMHGVAFCGLAADVSISALLDWIERADEKPPSRRTPADRVRAAIDSWHGRLWSGVSIAPETPLGRAPRSRHTFPGLSIEPLCNVGELIAEGRQQRHCVASLAESATRGAVCVYRADVLGMRATVAITRWCAGWMLMEASGFANMPLDDNRRAVIDAWVESLV